MKSFGVAAYARFRAGRIVAQTCHYIRNEGLAVVKGKPQGGILINIYRAVNLLAWAMVTLAALQGKPYEAFGSLWIGTQGVLACLVVDWFLRRPKVLYFIGLIYSTIAQGPF